MAERDDGGAAFPTTPIYNGDDEVVKAGPGMTLRDWFAGHAMNAALSHAKAKDEASLVELFETVARLAYAAADAMLAERAKGSR